MNRLIRGYGGTVVDVSDDVDEWESGDRGMTAIESWAATKVCLVTWSVLLGETGIEETLTDFRNPPGGTRRQLDYNTHRHLYQFGRFYELITELSWRVGDAEILGLPSAGEDETEQIVAKKLRNSLGVDVDAQRSWSGEVEALQQWQNRAFDCGVYVFSLPLSINQVRGVSRWDAGSPPSILLSTSDTPSARIFTLAHELAHLVHRPSKGTLCDPSINVSQTVETRMNKIAAEVLVPEDWLREEAPDNPPSPIFKDWPVKERRNLTRLFGVSSEMMGIRLMELGIVADHGYAKSPWSDGNIRRQRGSKGLGRGLKEPDRYRGYLGTKAVGLLRRALNQDIMTIGELTKTYIDVKPEVAEEIIAT